MAEADLRMRPGCMADLRTVPRGLRRTFDWRGRSTRTELAMLYFIPQLVCWTLLLIASLVTPDNWLRPAAFVAVIAVLIPLQSAVVRRLHDMAKPGWLVVPFAILSAIAMWVAWVGTGPIYPANDFWHNRDELRLLYGASWLAMIVVLMMPPKDENNPYGPNPRPAEKTI